MVGKAVNLISLLFKILSQITPNFTKAILNFCLFFSEYVGLILFMANSVVVNWIRDRWKFYG